MSRRIPQLLTAAAAVLSLAAVAYAAVEPSTLEPSTLEPSAIEPGAVQHIAEAAAPAAAHAASFDLMSGVFVFVLATFIGIGVIRRVSRLLHTPLMSLTNAISAIAVVGAVLVAGSPHYPLPMRVLGAVALFASMTNIVSGFLITQRMLVMFKQRGGGAK